MSTLYSKQDKEYIREQKRKLISELRNDFNKWESNTLKDYVLRLDDLVVKEIEARLLEIKPEQISSHIQNILINVEKLDISYGYIQKILPASHKRNYSECGMSTQLTEPDYKIITQSDTETIEKDQFGNYRINGKKAILKDDTPNVTSEVSVTTEIEQPRIVIENDTTKSIFALSRCGSILERIGQALNEIYHDDMESRKELDQVFATEYKKYKDVFGILNNVRDSIDDRRKWGNYEKIIAKFLIDVGATTANLAKLMDYSSKFGSIGIDRNDELLNFYQFLRSCPECKKDIHYTINEQIEKYKADEELRITLPTILKLH